ncbi:uncharacterized protein LAESUDRAFT_815296 [Laetiporus sulphureus 93-53]|uniref:Uncharacterized protein n=1 Tax=Laetiporus sulphureus 93-53 TaxID=1314785 RepID=A0A165C9U8_9APHY|nr:uncharacterized protein LAESUDRAFT_815296 [Laetiporus sulphureus 93-53]KZT02443.1 hypothetical protein LAESUDRAFT_815296 [Laetiporus sulphureus 93-53]
MEDLKAELLKLVPLFFTLHIVGGHVGLPMLVCTFFASKTTRSNPIIINFCVTWVIYSISFCLLFYGNYTRADHVPAGLCAIQASLVYGSTAMTAVAGLIMVVQIWSTFCAPWGLPYVSSLSRAVKLTIVLSVPYMTLLLCSAASGYVAVTHPDNVIALSGIYCSIETGFFSTSDRSVVLRNDSADSLRI